MEIGENIITDQKLRFVLFHDNETLRGAGWQKLCEGTKGLRQKVLSWTKILNPIIRYFVAILIFVANYSLFENLWIKKVFF